MDQETAENLSREVGINATHIVREEYEMIILNEILGSPLGDHLVFKGGTALRLAYDSPRFSEDLDFSTLKSFSCQKIKQVYQKLTAILPSLSLAEFRDKYFTCFALFKIKEPFLPQTFSIKVEISKRKVNWKKDIDYHQIVLHTPISPIKTFALVATQERIWKDKKRALSGREKARDLFDLWYLGQILKKPIDFKKIKTNQDSKKIKSELNQFLPEKYRRVIKELRK